MESKRCRSLHRLHRVSSLSLWSKVSYRLAWKIFGQKSNQQQHQLTTRITHWTDSTWRKTYHSLTIFSLRIAITEAYSQDAHFLSLLGHIRGSRPPQSSGWRMSRWLICGLIIRWAILAGCESFLELFNCWMKIFHNFIWIGNVFGYIADFTLLFTCGALWYFQITLARSARYHWFEIREFTLTFLARHLLHDLSTDGAYWSISQNEISRVKMRSLLASWGPSPRFLVSTFRRYTSTDSFVFAKAIFDDYHCFKHIICIICLLFTHILTRNGDIATGIDLQSGGFHYFWEC
jgi:hypothetical protein